MVVDFQRPVETVQIVEFGCEGFVDVAEASAAEFGALAG